MLRKVQLVAPRARVPSTFTRAGERERTEMRASSDWAKAVLDRAMSRSAQAAIFLNKDLPMIWIFRPAKRIIESGRGTTLKAYETLCAARQKRSTHITKRSFDSAAQRCL